MPNKNTSKPKKNLFDVYDPGDTIKDLIRFVYDRKRAMEDSEDRQRMIRMYDLWEKQYEMWREDKEAGQWQSNHVVPITFSAIETAMSELIDQNLRPIALPRGSEDSPRARITNFLLDGAWYNSHSENEFYNIIKDTLIFGTAIGQEYYWQDRRIIQTKVHKEKKDGLPVYDEEEVIDYDDVYLESVKLTEFFVDETARSLMGPFRARDCIRRYIMNIDDFRAFFKGEIWDPLGAAQYVKAGGDTEYYEHYKPPEGIDKSNQVEVLWYWSERPKDQLLIVANNVMVRPGCNPFKHKRLPFVRAVDVKRPYKFYGKGESEILESMQDEGNVLRRMTIDRNHLDIDKMFFVSNRLALSDEDLIARPHGAIPVDDVNGAKAIDYNDVPRSVEISIQHLEDDSTIATGINPRAQSLPQAGTATEASMLKESTLKRLRLKVWSLKTEFLLPLTRLRLSNIIQFYSQPKLTKVVGDAASSEFQTEVAKLKEQGLLFENDKHELFKKNYRSIRTEGFEITNDTKGKLTEQPANGFNFFEAQPKYFVPLHPQGYDLKFDVSANIQISKALMKTQSLEYYDRMSALAMSVPNSYDPVKLADWVSREAYDIDPTKLKVSEQAPDDSQQRLEQQVQLAAQENKMLLAGQPVPPTPYASPVHTQIHIQAMNAPDFQKLPNDSPAVQNFVAHVTGEIMAIESRGGQGGTQEAEMAQGNPAEGGASSVSAGITNRPGGMSKPGAPLSRVMPDYNSGGGNRHV